MTKKLCFMTRLLAAVLAVLTTAYMAYGVIVKPPMWYPF